MRADRLGAARLVDARCAEAAVGLLDDVAADPAHVVRHLLVGDLRRPRGSRLEVGWRCPAVASHDQVQVHRGSFGGGCLWHTGHRAPLCLRVTFTVTGRPAAPSSRSAVTVTVAAAMGVTSLTTM